MTDVWGLLESAGRVIVMRAGRRRYTKPVSGFVTTPLILQRPSSKISS